MTTHQGLQTVSTQFVTASPSGVSGAVNSGAVITLNGMHISSGTATYPGYLQGASTTFAPITSQVFTTTSMVIGNNRLTPDQLAFVLAQHRFLPMDGSGYCLFCYALDLFRTKVDHLFVIREE